ncbi:site-2 protease family protein [filamentous cyanobacterium LEGE 11480]|uniref:Zinc metalloprotease n=1 Tax=Romeriopsis navalis LEGE 11480 TaxID=2777977 RepID=A0A928VQ06_9CYAN|nr:site-2 protease family protein [Romeriopsis navalis]MBE9030014.1 site-2 protease family protein [Romeriopsis navalis LEGE 11480]
MNSSLRIGNLFGIPFFVNVSWFFVLALVTLNFSGGLAAQFPTLGTAAWGLGLGAGLLMFASVLLHELGHSFAAQQQGIKVNSITLFLFGGLASLEDEAKTPAGAFWIAIAGPLVSLALFLLLTGLTASGLVNGPIGSISRLLAYINLSLALFNMIPGLPLDGGNVLKAAIWQFTGNRYRGIQWASRMGMVIGGVAMSFGALSVLGISNIGSFWTLIIGWFIWRNAKQSANSATIQETLSGLTAADVVLENSPIIQADSTLRQLADIAVVTTRNQNWQRFLVQDSQAQLIGTIPFDTIRSIPAHQWPDYQVKDFVQSIQPEVQVQANQSLLTVIEQFERQGIQALAVIRENGTLVGLLEKAQIIQLLQQRTQTQMA